jgi:hypothetical protein
VYAGALSRSMTCHCKWTASESVWLASMSRYGCIIVEQSRCTLRRRCASRQYPGRLCEIGATVNGFVATPGDWTAKILLCSCSVCAPAKIRRPR